MKKIMKRIFSYQQVVKNDPIFNSLKSQFFSLMEGINYDKIKIYLGFGYSEDIELKASQDVIILETKKMKKNTMS